MKIYTIRYMWRLKDCGSVNFKIVTDTKEGLELFEKQLVSSDNLENACKEYLHEYDCTRLGVIEPIENEDEMENN